MAIPPLGTILCPVDLSESSRRALKHAAAFAHHPDSRLVIVRVDPRADGLIAERTAALQELNEFVRATLPGSAWTTRRSGPDLILRSGGPAAMILRVAHEVDARLVVMSTRGRGALSRAFVGSTATTVLRETGVPVALVSASGPDAVSLSEAGATVDVQAIVVPYDLRSDISAQLRWAAWLSAGTAKPLLVLHVVAPGAARGSELDRVQAAVGDVDAAHGFRALVREGRVVPEVIAAVKAEGAGVVVMGRSSEAPGAMAYEILRRTDALVVVVPEGIR